MRLGAARLVVELAINRHDADALVRRVEQLERLQRQGVPNGIRIQAGVAGRLARLERWLPEESPELTQAQIRRMSDEELNRRILEIVARLPEDDPDRRRAHEVVAQAQAQAARWRQRTDG